MKGLVNKLPEAILVSTVLNLIIGIPALAMNLVVNGSFEDGNFSGPSFTRLGPGSSDLTGWTIGGSGVDWHNSVEMQFPVDGDLVVDLNLDGSSSGTISQTFSTNPGEFYTLGFYLAGPDLGFPDPRQVRVDIAGVFQIFSTPASVNTDMLWQEHQLTFEAIGEQTTVAFSSLDNSGFWGPVLDDVSVVSVASVPESSSTLSLIALGTLGTGLAIFHNSRRQQS